MMMQQAGDDAGTAVGRGGGPSATPARPVAVAVAKAELPLRAGEAAATPMNE